MKFTFFCILIVSVNGWNSTNLDFYLLEPKLQEAACRSFQKQMGQVYGSCANKDVCEIRDLDFNITEYTVVNNGSLLKLPQLVCIEQHFAHLSWIDENDYAYCVQLTRENFTSISNITTCSFYSLQDLSNNALYNVQLWAISYTKKLIILSDRLQIHTVDPNIIPSPVTNVSVGNITCNESSCDAVIQWSQNEEHSCTYDLLWVKDGTINEHRISVVSGRHEKTLTDLKFSTSYTVQIIARNGDSFLNESPKTLFHFMTPTCFEYHSSLDKCRPSPPEDLVIQETPSISTNEVLRYDVHLTWKKPTILPSYYITNFRNLIGNDIINLSQNITGNSTESVFENVELGDLYHISLQACSRVGCSGKIVEERHLVDLNVEIPSLQSQEWKAIVIAVASLIAVATFFLGIYFCFYKSKHKNQRAKYFSYLFKKRLDQDKNECTENIEVNLMSEEVTDQWEVEPSKLTFQNIIGEGAFGVVRKAILETNMTKLEVAVKMLKENPSVDDIRQFSQEINIMKSVGQHPYVVSMIGCISEGQVGGPMLVVEYCSRGDLQTYLRNAWEKCCNMRQDFFDSDESSNKESNYFANKVYDLHNMNMETDFILQPKHLLSIARQVALGMEHLAKTRVVHRDLAARNVLLCENHTVKVSDFGLSRDIYRDNVYCKSTGGKLPIRWMAIESLTHQRYTTYSDVWSYGILLWEIVTLGGTPYAGVHSSELLQFLRDGNRLPKPSNCSAELYSLMQNCWSFVPKNRPTFTEICKILEDLLENVSEYLRIENSEMAQDNEKKTLCLKPLGQNLSAERYVKPLTNF